jgi:photosystem II stability/assembly factor-like uncharacterized protein
MKSRLFLLACVALFAMSESPPAAGQTPGWELLGPEGGYVTALAQAPSNGNFLYAATQGYPTKGFKTTDHGEHWAATADLPTVALVLMVDQSSSSTVYGIAYSYFMQTTNGGGTWSQQYLPSNCYAYDVVQDPVASSTFHAGGYTYDGSQSQMGYFQTTDKGANWRKVQVTTEVGYAYAIEVDRVNPQHIYVGGYVVIGSYGYGRVYKSTNGGTSFSDITGTIQGTVNDILADPGVGGKVFVATNAGVYKTTNGGTAWAKNSGYLPSAYLIRQYIPNKNIMYASTYNTGVYRSTDGGVNWSATGGGIIGTGAGGLAVEGSTPECIFVGNKSGIYRSTNAGTAWQQKNSGLRATNITALACAPSSPTNLYAAVEYDAVYKTTGATQTSVVWNRLPDFYACENVTSIIISSTDPDRLYAFEGGG